jgi:PAS domain S-box-containing protein
MSAGASDEPVPDVPTAAIEESAEDLYENAPCGYLSALPGGEIVRVNKTFLNWTGFERDEVIGRRFQDLLTPGGRIFHETHYAPLLRMQGEVREIAVEIECAGGRRLPALINSVLRFDDAGDPIVTRTTVFNASDRKQYERELVSARERERSARERTERLQRLTAALAASLEPAEIAAAVCEEMTIEDADAVSFALVTGDELEIAAARGGDATTTGRRLALPVAGPVADAMSNGAPVFLADPPAAADDATRLLLGDAPPAAAILPLGRSPIRSSPSLPRGPRSRRRRSNARACTSRRPTSPAGPRSWPRRATFSTPAGPSPIARTASCD